MQPLLTIEAGETAAANGPENAVRAGCEAAEALVDFRRQRHIHESKRPFGRTGGFEVLRARDPDAAVGREADAGRNGIGSRDFFGADSSRVETGESAGIAKDPDRAVGRDNHFAGQGAVEAVFRFPDSPAIGLRVPHGDAIVGAEPEALAFIAQFAPDDVVGKPFDLRPTGPGSTPDPALDAGAAQANP